MARSPIWRILAPLLLVIAGSIVVSIYLRLGPGRQPVAELPSREPRIVTKLQSAYDIKRSVSNTGISHQFLDNRIFVVVGPDGTEWWRFDTEHTNATAHAETYSGEVYITCQDGCLWSLDETGKLRWHTNVLSEPERKYLETREGDPANAPSISDPLTDFHGNVYLLLRKRVVCYSPEGKLKYVCDLSDPPGVEFMNNTVVGFQVSWDGHAFVATSETGRTPDDGLRIIRPDGKLRVKAPLQGRAHVSPRNDIIIDEHMPGTWTAYDYNWRKLWELPINSNVIKFDDYGNSYATTREGMVVKVSPTGQKLWSTWIKGEDLYTEGDEPVFVLQRFENRVVALDESNGKPLWETAPSAEQQAAAVKSQTELNGGGDEYPFALVYVYGDMNGTVYFEGTANWLFATDSR